MATRIKQPCQTCGRMARESFSERILNGGEVTKLWCRRCGWIPYCRSKPERDMTQTIGGKITIISPKESDTQSNG